MLSLFTTWVPQLCMVHHLCRQHVSSALKLGMALETVLTTRAFSTRSWNLFIWERRCILNVG